MFLVALDQPVPAVWAVTEANAKRSHVQQGHDAPTFCTAGVLEDGRLAKHTPGSFRRVAAGKVAGVQALERSLSAAPTRGVIAFSSVSSIVAPLGQPNYASANASLCAWASAKAAQGR